MSMDSIWVLVIAFNKRVMGPSVLLMGLACLLAVFSMQVSATVYLTSSKFVSQNFKQPPKTGSLWLTDAHQKTAKRILGHPYRGLRIRYWQSGARTAWIMGEVGKEKPITVGVIIDGDLIEKVSILEFRETRGGEVRHPFFTEQFAGLFLRDNFKLSSRIDGITGATLSVRAVSNVSRYALFLHKSLTTSLSDNMDGVRTTSERESGADKPDGPEKSDSTSLALAGVSILGEASGGGRIALARR